MAIEGCRQRAHMQLPQKPLEPAGSVDELVAEGDARQSGEDAGREGRAGRRNPCVRQSRVKSERDRQAGHRRAGRRGVEQHQHRHRRDKGRHRVEQGIQEPAVRPVDAVEIFVRHLVAEQVHREQRDPCHPDPDSALRGHHQRRQHEAREEREAALCDERLHDSASLASAPGSGGRACAGGSGMRPSRRRKATIASTVVSRPGCCLARGWRSRALR